MHEYSIVGALVERVAEEAARRRATAIMNVRVRIGELAGVDPALLATAWDAFRAAGPCADASLEIVAVGATWECPRCGDAIARGALLRCARCDEPARLVCGDEIILERIEMEI